MPQHITLTAPRPKEGEDVHCGMHAQESLCLEGLYQPLLQYCGHDNVVSGHQTTKRGGAAHGRRAHHDVFVTSESPLPPRSPAGTCLTPFPQSLPPWGEGQCSTPYLARKERKMYFFLSHNGVS